MLRVANPPAKPKRQIPARVKYVGLLRDARTLGVHRNHLYLVLSGRRVSHSLLRKYNALKRSRY